MKKFFSSGEDRISNPLNMIHMPAINNNQRSLINNTPNNDKIMENNNIQRSYERINIKPIIDVLVFNTARSI